jgi:hypothetical protein
LNPVNQPVIKQENSIDIELLNLAELKEECKNRGLTGYSNLNKAELIELLKEEKE